MHNEKSWGFSTKSSSNFLNSPPKSASKHNTFKIDEAEERETVFLREKNRQLQELVLRMGEEIMKLSKDKHELLELNSKYIDTVNKQFKQNHLLFEQFRTSQHLPKNCSSCKCKILFQFQSDYRNLVKHCINLEEEIKSKNGDLSQLQQLRKELLKSNHTSITELLQQLIDTTHELVTLKRIYNKQEFQFQKNTQKYEKMQQSAKQTQKTGSNLVQEVENYKSLINTIKNESVDKENHYKSKIYSLELTIERLQKDAREQQKQNQYSTSKNSILKAEQIEYLQHNLQDRLNVKTIRNIRSQSMHKGKIK